MQVLVRDNNVDQALRVLKKKLQREGIFREMRMREAFEKPSVKRAREKAEAVEEFRRTHGLYRFTVESSVEDPERVVHLPEELVSGNIPAALGCWDWRELMIPHDIAKKLSAVPHLTIELVGEARK